MVTAFAEYEHYDGVDLARLVRQREVSPGELLEAALERYGRRNSQYNAVNRLMETESWAALADALPQGPLHGVPFLLKDLNVLYRGVPTSNGGGYCATGTADHDWELTRRYKAAGLVIFGKTSTPELGINASTEPREYGPTRNPWNPAYSAGGSSGGAAAAVAAGLVPVAHASDGGGSIRIPASFCGLVGLKPTRGRISFAPDLGEGWAGLGTPHVVSRTVRDSAAWLDAVAGCGVGDPYAAAPPSGPFVAKLDTRAPRLQIAFSTATPGGAPVHDECRRAVERTVSLCESLGHTLVEASPRIRAAELERAIETIIAANLWAVLQARDAVTGRAAVQGDVENITWLWAQRGRTTGAADFVRATQTIHAVGRELASFFAAGHDLVLTPTVAHPPFRIGERNAMGTDLEHYLGQLFMTIAFTAQYNASGQPAISLPMHWSAEGLPIGIQFAAPQGEEGRLLRIARELEVAQPWDERRPPGLA